MDVDGVLTDGRIVLGENEELKFFDVHDGMGIALAKRAGLKVGFITSRSSTAVERRAKELDVDYICQGCQNKLAYLEEIIKKENINHQNVCFIGDDINDIPLLRKVGLPTTVHDAPDYIKKEATYVSSKPGGKGAVREIIEHILKLNGRLDTTIEDLVRE